MIYIIAFIASLRHKELTERDFLLATSRGTVLTERTLSVLAFDYGGGAVALCDIDIARLA